MVNTVGGNLESSKLFICVGEGTAKCSLEKAWTLEFGKPDLESLIPDLQAVRLWANWLHLFFHL